MRPAAPSTPVHGTGTLLAAVGVLTLLYGAVYGRHAAGLGLVTDDWGHLHDAVAGYAFAGLLHTWPTDYRPFEMAPWILAYAVFGHALTWYYGLLFAVEYLTAVVLLVLVRTLSGSALLGLAVAALWAVYPADNAVFWLTSFAYRTGALFLVLALTLLLLPRRRTGGLAYGSAVLCCLLCLLSNEIYLGLASALPLVAAWTARDHALTARVGRAAPFVLTLGAYLTYRLWIGPHVLLLPDFKAGNYALTVPHAWDMLTTGVHVVVTSAWRDAADRVLSSLPRLAPLHQALASTEVLLGLGLGGLGLAGVTWLLQAVGEWGFWARRYAAVQTGARVLGAGAVASVGGYLPLALTVDAPTLDGLSSRVNAAAALGAAAFVAGALWVLLQWALPRSMARMLFLISMALLLTLGLARKEEDATSATAAWAAQRQIWQAVLTAAPALRPATFVLLVPRDRASSAILNTLTPWGVNSALKLLYFDPHNDLSVQGDVLPLSDGWRTCRLRPAAVRPWLRVPSLRFLQGGLQMRVLHQFVPYARVLILRYEVHGGGRFEIVHGRFHLPWGCSAVSSPDRIIPATTARASWRDLVGK